MLSKARCAEGPITFSPGEILSFGEDRAHIWSSFCILLRVEGRNHIRSLPPLAPAHWFACSGYSINIYGVIDWTRSVSLKMERKERMVRLRKWKNRGT